MGKLIIIEGTDGSGKATQTKLLLDYLQKNGQPVLMADFPRYDTFTGQLVGRYLNGDFGDVFDVHPQLASLLYAFDRLHARDTIRTHLATGGYVVANRYVLSNMAFQAAKLPPQKRKAYWQWNEELEYRLNQLPREDIIIFLYLPPVIGQQLVDKKAARGYTNKKRDIHERNIEYLQLVGKQYLNLCRRYQHMHKINCLDRGGNLRSVDNIHQAIISILQAEKII